jgi:hypothetical protein
MQMELANKAHRIALLTDVRRLSSSRFRTAVFFGISQIFQNFRFSSPALEMTMLGWLEGRAYERLTP